MARYEDLENSLVALFTGVTTVFDIIPLPDFEADYKPQSPRPQVYVSYDSSDFTEPDTVSKVVQDERLNVGFEIRAKYRRGDKGVLAIAEAITRRVLGAKLTGYDKMILVKSSPLQGTGPGNWLHYLQFSTSTKVVDVQNEPDYSEYVLTEPECSIAP